MYAVVSSSSCFTSSLQNTCSSSSAVTGFNVPGFSSGAGFTFMSARRLYHAVGSSSSVRYVLYGTSFVFISIAPSADMIL